MAEVINPAIVPKVTLPSGEQVPCVGMGTFGSDRVSAERYVCKSDRYEDRGADPVYPGVGGAGGNPSAAV